MGFVHILNGDALTNKMHTAGIVGDFVVCRECLIEGPASPEITEEFWNQRADFISRDYHGSHNDYFSLVRDELAKLRHIPPDTTICLWFEDDLFCQANLWFVLKYLKQAGTPNQLFRVFPQSESRIIGWDGFGSLSDSEIQYSFSQRVPFSDEEYVDGCHLWDAYASKDFKTLRTLSQKEFGAFRFLPEVVNAHISRFGRFSQPEQVLNQIMHQGKHSFNEIFSEFSKQEGVYGFGDLQVKRLISKINQRKFF